MRWFNLLYHNLFNISLRKTIDPFSPFFLLKPAFMSKYLLSFFLFVIGSTGYTQTTSLSLDSCLSLARENYPMIKQLDLITKTEKYNVSNISKAWWPQFNLNAQATYQSEVTHFDLKIPGLDLPAPPNKDQYKIYLDIGQVIYDGGQISAQKNIARTSSRMEMIKTESELYKIKERVQQLYFGNLLIQKQLKSVDLLNIDLNEQIKKAKAALEAKAISANILYALEAEQLKADQRKDELKSSQAQWILLLSKFINRNLDSNVNFILPDAPPLNTQINRPEIKLYDQQASLSEYQYRNNRSSSIPHLQAFVQLGYSNPALNFLKEGFQSYYIAGLKFNWNLSSFYTKANGSRINISNKNIAELQKETFLFNSQLSLIQQQEEINKYQKLLATDKELVELRRKIKEAAKAQWENGVITVSDYLRELNAEEQARTNEAIHQIQFLQSAYLHHFYSGN